MQTPVCTKLQKKLCEVSKTRDLGVYTCPFCFGYFCFGYFLMNAKCFFSKTWCIFIKCAICLSQLSFLIPLLASNKIAQLIGNCHLNLAGICSVHDTFVAVVIVRGQSKVT